MFTIFAGSSFVEHADAILLRKNPDALWKDSDSVFVGTIHDSRVVPNSENTQEREIYTVYVEHYFKNHLGKQNIEVLQPVKNDMVLGSFNVGDRVLFYLEEGTYAPESCLVESGCTAGQMAYIIPMEKRALQSDIMYYSITAFAISGIVATTVFVVWRKRK